MPCVPPPRRTSRVAAFVGFIAALLSACGPGVTLRAQERQALRPFADDLLAPVQPVDDADADADGAEADKVPLLPIERVVRFSVSGNDLVLATDFKIGDGRRQIRLKEMEGNTRVEVGQRPRNRIGLVPFFKFTHEGAATQDGTGSVQITVDVQGARLSLKRVYNFEDVQTTVTLVQEDAAARNRWGVDRRFEEGRSDVQRPDRVRLQVRVVRPSMPATDEVRVQAASFAELLRRYPGEAARHLAPVFRQLGQDAAVFRVDDRVAWQLFPAAVDADQLTASKVTELVTRLDDVEFRQRELATAELEVLGGPAMQILGEMDRTSLTAEQNARVDAILARYAPLDPDEAAELLDDAEFLLRCFTYSDVSPVRAAAAKALETKLGETLNLDPRAALPKRVAAADAVRERHLTDER